MEWWTVVACVLGALLCVLLTIRKQQKDLGELK